MRFVVYGAGAIGGVVGARLHEGGHDVLLIARGPHLQAVQANGLRLEWPDGSVELDVPAVEHPSAITWRDDDVVLLATKSQDTASVSHALAAVAPPTTPVVCLQNGVSNEREVLRRFERVHAAVVMCPAGHLSPGIVQAYSVPITGLIDIGRYPTGSDETSEAVAAALNSSTFDSRVEPSVMRWKYGKLLMNLLNALDAATGISGDMKEVIDRTRAEAAACFAAAGIDYADRDEDAARRSDLLTVRSVGDDPRPGGSSFQSLHRGTGAIETDYLNGEIVLLGRLHGIATPVNELLQRVANQMAREGRPPRSMPEHELLAQVPPRPD
jgi:2-dehydropantoate 2-reductase